VGLTPVSVPDRGHTSRIIATSKVGGRLSNPDVRPPDCLQPTRRSEEPRARTNGWRSHGQFISLRTNKSRTQLNDADTKSSDSYLRLPRQGRARMSVTSLPPWDRATQPSGVISPLLGLSDTRLPPAVVDKPLFARERKVSYIPLDIREIGRLHSP